MFYNARIVISSLNNSTTVNVYIHITYVHNITENARVACASLDWDHTFLLLERLLQLAIYLTKTANCLQKYAYKTRMHYGYHNRIHSLLVNLQ